MLNMSRKDVLNLVGLLVVSVNILNAQVPKESVLFQTLKEKDKQMFSVGFNQCNIEEVEKLTYENFEFYHDKDGVTGSKEDFIKVIEDDLCRSGKNVITRVLDESSLDVFPMYDRGELYGAMQTGIHSFGSTSARFMHLWMLDNDEWKLSRVMSYNHKTENTSMSVEPNFIILSDAALDFYEGDYQFSPDFILSMVSDSGKLYGNSQGEKVEIKAYAKHKFVAMDNSVKIHFNLDARGRLIGLSMVTPDGEMVAKKIK